MSEESHEAPGPAGKRIVLVTGTGRSGTSTMAGTLEALGLHVPGPVRPPDAANPRGFFETKRIIEFHTDLLNRARAHTMDGDPNTVVRARRVITESTRQELRSFLEEATADHDELVIKDPRMLWFIPMWLRVASSMNISVSFASMLRHPAEAVGSRTVYWSVSDNPERVRSRQIANLAGWVNVSLINEQRTRGQRRAFVRYDDLISDWRGAMKGVGARLDLGYGDATLAHKPHPVDDFIDPNLRRVRVRWDELDVPQGLREIAERTWQALQKLVEPRSRAGKARKQLDELRREFDVMYADARAVTLDATRASIEGAVRRHDRVPNDAAPASGARDTAANAEKASGDGAGASAT